MKNLVLIGPRGSGKTTTARLLSSYLNKNYVELDRMIEEKSAMNIPNMVERRGWTYFRNIETEVVKQVAQLKDTIISTGGGVITRQENINELRRNGIVIFLTA